MNSRGEGRVLSYRQASDEVGREGQAKPFGLSSVLILRKLKSSLLSDIQYLNDESVLDAPDVK